MSSYSNQLPLGASSEKQRPSQHPQALQKYNAILDQSSLQESADKGGVGYYTADLGNKDNWRTRDGQIAFVVRREATPAGRKKNQLGFNQIDSATIYIRTNLAGIGSPGMSKSAFIDLIDVKGICITETEMPDQQYGVADRRTTVVVSKGALHAFNLMNVFLPAGKPVFWDVKDPGLPASATGREMGRYGIPDGAPYLFFREFKPEEHLFSRELLRDMRKNADARTENPDPTYDEAYERMISLVGGLAVEVALQLVGAATANGTDFLPTNTPKGNRERVANNPAALVLLAAQQQLLSTRNPGRSNAAAVLRKYLSPLDASEMVSTPTEDRGKLLQDAFFPENKFSSPLSIQKNALVMLGNTFRRWETYVTRRIMGVFPSGGQPGSRDTFFVDY